MAYIICFNCGKIWHYGDRSWRMYRCPKTESYHYVPVQIYRTIEDAKIAQVSYEEYKEILDLRSFIYQMEKELNSTCSVKTPFCLETRRVLEKKMNCVPALELKFFRNVVLDLY